MKKFSFRLHAFLKLKEMKEKQKLYELAEVSGQIDKNQQTIQFYHHETERLHKQRNTNLDNANNLILINTYLFGLKQKMNIAQRDNIRLQPELQKRQKALLEARKEKKTVEVIKEKHLAEYWQFVKKEELKEIDDYNDKLKRYV